MIRDKSKGYSGQWLKVVCTCDVRNNLLELDFAEQDGSGPCDKVNLERSFPCIVI